MKVQYLKNNQCERFELVTSFALVVSENWQELTVTQDISEVRCFLV